MIYVQLMGGLSNCMFQISTALVLGWENNDEVIVSEWTQSITERKEKEKFWKKTIFKRINRVNSRPPSITRIYREPNYLYNKIPYTKNMQLFGYYQSPKYFDKYKDKLLDIFLEYKHEIQNYLDNIMNNISNKPKISIHVRRQDYLKLQHCHIVLDDSYYENAINKLSETLDLKKYTFLIFSDDIPWCKESQFFNNLENKHFITECNDVHELYLMSMCDHNIIANSSYSWWGSYLNLKDHITISPKNWFNSSLTGGKGPARWDTLYCDGWITV